MIKEKLDLQRKYKIQTLARQELKVLTASSKQAEIEHETTKNTRSNIYYIFHAELSLDDKIQCICVTIFHLYIHV